jgi:hypothetical protein
MEIERLRRVLCGMLLLEVFPVFPKQPLFRVKKLTGKCKKINWTPNAWLNSISHHTGFSTSEASSMLKVQISYKLLPSPEGVPTSRMPVQTLRIDTLGTKTAFDTRADDITEHILTALQRFFNKAGYRTERKHVPQSHGLKKADLWIKDFQLEGIRNIDVTLHHKFHGSCANLINNWEPSHPDANGTLDAPSRRSSTTTNILHRAQFFLFAGRHDDLRENQRGLPPPALHTVPPTGRELLHSHP